MGEGEGGGDLPPKNISLEKLYGLLLVVSSWKVGRSFQFSFSFCWLEVDIKEEHFFGRSFFPDFCVGVFFPPDGGVMGVVAILSTGSIARLDPQTRGAAKSM